MIVGSRQGVHRDVQPLGHEDHRGLGPDPASGHDLHPRDAVTRDDLAERGRPAYQVRDAGRARIERDRGKLRMLQREIDDHNAGIFRERSRERHCGPRRAVPGGCADNRDALATLSGFAQRGRKIVDRDVPCGLSRRAACFRGRDGFDFHRLVGRLGADEALGQPAPLGCGLLPLRHRLLGNSRDRLSRWLDRCSGAVNVAREKLARGDKACRDKQCGERRHQHDRQLLREIRGVGHERPRDDARVGRREPQAVARGRLAVLGEIGFRAGRAAPLPRARARAARYPARWWTLPAA